MGYASYLEDIRDRLADSLAEIHKTIVETKEKPNTARDPADLLRAVESVYRKVYKLHHDLKELVDLATDPSMDLADEVLRLREQCRAVGDQEMVHRCSIEAERDARAAAEKKAKEAARQKHQVEQKLKAERVRRRATEKELARCTGGT